MSAPIKVGDVIAGKYRIERVLGSGGMGIVMAARHLKLGERVAIKFLQREVLKDPARVERFLREARASARIRGEHIARVYDIGTLDNELPYIVMEYLRGNDLSALLKQHGPFPVHIVAEYSLQVCEALADAHAAGIVHRDLKPANLFVTERSDGSPMIKVIDFGIAKVIEGADGAIDATKTGEEIRGSPLYMSPEQMRKPRQIDARSDIWSFGVTLYNLLTGSYPFFSLSVLELCGMIFHEPPAPIHDKRPDVPAEMEAIIVRCLEKDPAKRYADVGELAAALAEFAPPEARIAAERTARILRFQRPTDSMRLPSLSQPDLPAPPERPGTSPSALLERGLAFSASFEFTPISSPFGLSSADSMPPSTIPSPSPLDRASRAPQAPSLARTSQSPQAPSLARTSQSPQAPSRASSPTYRSSQSPLPPVSSPLLRASQAPVSPTPNHLLPHLSQAPPVEPSPLATSQSISLTTAPTGSIWTSTELSSTELSEVKKPRSTAKWAAAGMLVLLAGGGALALLRPRAAVSDPVVVAAPPAGESSAVPGPSASAPEPAAAPPVAPPVASSEASADALAGAASGTSKAAADKAPKTAPPKRAKAASPRGRPTGAAAPSAPSGGLFKTRK